MSTYMTPERADQLMTDALRSGRWKPFPHSYGTDTGTGELVGCAICGLYLGCGGEVLDPETPFLPICNDHGARLKGELVGAYFASEVDFLTSGVTEPPVHRRDLEDLEYGFMEYGHGSGPWWDLGQKWRRV